MLFLGRGGGGSMRSNSEASAHDGTLFFCPPVLSFGQVGVEDITDVIEGFEEEVQSVDMATMNKI